MRSGLVLLCSLLAMTGLAIPGVVAANVSTLHTAAATGSVQFVSDAPLEKFTGKSSKVSGNLSFDPANLKTAKGEFSVEVASIKTNLALRDEHLASDSWLDAKKFPKTKFVIEKVAGAAKLEPGVTTALKVSGKYTLHGISKQVTADAKVRYQPSSKDLHVLATFVVHLEDYGVSIPKLVSLKVSPDIVVNVDLHASVK